MFELLELKHYIENAEEITINDQFKVKMSKELYERYKTGEFDNYFYMLDTCIKEIDKLGIKYPGGAKPTYYVYMIPTDKAYMLQIPANFDTGRGGGRPVPSFERDGFPRAYGVTDNMCSNVDITDKKIISNIHELTHLVSNMFFTGSRYLSEGVSEAVPYYVMGMEEDYPEHSEMMAKFNEDIIIPVEKLKINGVFDSLTNMKIINNSSCTFRASYVSSYLAVAALLEKYKDKYGVSKEEALQLFYDTLRGKNDSYYYEGILCDQLGINPNTFCNETEYQKEYVRKLKR